MKPPVNASANEQAHGPWKTRENKKSLRRDHPHAVRPNLQHTEFKRNEDPISRLFPRGLAGDHSLELGAASRETTPRSRAGGIMASSRNPSSVKREMHGVDDGIHERDGTRRGGIWRFVRSGEETW
jgi:hypothetical protein